jgi:hypothetical protein
MGLTDRYGLDGFDDSVAQTMAGLPAMPFRDATVSVGTAVAVRQLP